MGAIAELWGAHEQAGAANHATDAQVQGAEMAINEQKREYDQSRTDQLPWLTAGTNALGQLGHLNSGDTSSFHESPDYQYGLDQLIKNDDRSAAAHGRLYSGGYGQDFAKDVIGYADQGYNTYYNRIAALAGLGQTTAQNLGTLGANYANQVGQDTRYAGDARASGYINKSNAYSNALSSLTSQFSQAGSMLGGG